MPGHCCWQCLRYIFVWTTVPWIEITSRTRKTHMFLCQSARYVLRVKGDTLVALRAAHGKDNVTYPVKHHDIRFVHSLPIIVSRMPARHDASTRIRVSATRIWCKMRTSAYWQSAKKIVMMCVSFTHSKTEVLFCVDLLQRTHIMSSAAFRIAKHSPETLLQWLKHT